MATGLVRGGNNIGAFLHPHDPSVPSGHPSFLGLVIDDAKENDKTFDHDGVSFVGEDSLFATCGAIKVDFRGESEGGCGWAGSGGFIVTSEKHITDDGCGCSCTSGSCG